MTNKTRGSHTFEVKTDPMNEDFLVDWLTAIIPEDWTKRNKNNFVCIGALASKTLISSLQIIMSSKGACKA